MFSPSFKFKSNTTTHINWSKDINSINHQIDIIMITCQFTTGRKPQYYEVTVTVPGFCGNYCMGVYTKAPIDAVISALRACVKDSYTLKVDLAKGFHSEYESLDTACAQLSRLRFVEYTTKEVEKTVIVTETVKREL